MTVASILAQAETPMTTQGSFWAVMAMALGGGSVLGGYFKGLFEERKLRMKLEQQARIAGQEREQADTDRLWQQLEADRKLNAEERDKTARQIGGLQQQVMDLKKALDQRDQTIARVRAERDAYKIRCDDLEAELARVAAGKGRGKKRPRPAAPTAAAASNS